LLKKFQTEKGRILPRRITGTCLRHQKMLSVAVKRARIISIVL
ncbi:MAG: 30S ribosomal protein S18, partial [Lentisphaeria bacterium]|nr:30S ribosomal protein S18 [Lentisphaeria bacterium]